MEIDRPIAIAVILFITLGLGFFVVAPKYQGFKDLQIKISEQEAELKGKTKYFLEIVKAFEKLKENKESIEKIDSALPPEFSLSSLVNLLQQKTAENGLIFQRINLHKILPITEGRKIQENHFFLEVSGAYSSFRNFLSSLEKSSRLIEIESISFTSRKEIEGFYSFKLTIRVHSY